MRNGVIWSDVLGIGARHSGWNLRGMDQYITTWANLRETISMMNNIVQSQIEYGKYKMSWLHINTIVENAILYS